MTNEIIKERMMREATRRFEMFDICKNTHEYFRKMYLTDDINNHPTEIAIKIYTIFDAITNEFDEYNAITTMVTPLNAGAHIIHNDHILFKTDTKTNTWAWDTLDELKEYMYNVYTELKLSLESELTLDDMHRILNFIEYASCEECHPSCSDTCAVCGHIGDKIGNRITQMEKKKWI